MPETTNTTVTNKKNLMIWILFIIVLIGVFLGCLLRPCGAPAGTCLVFSTIQTDPLWMWRIFMLLLFLFCLVAGYAIKERWSGLFIDQRNKISLSRFQLVLWTALLLSGFLVAVLINLCLGIKDPLFVTMDQQLWALMGISGTSLVAAGLIQTNKRNQKPKSGDAESRFREAIDDPKAKSAEDSSATRTRVEGVLVENTSAESASWLDMFMGDEVGNGAWLDIGKIQMFVFTLIVWFTYAAALANKIAFATQESGLKEFPALDNGIVALLAISHAAYIGNKAVPQTGGPLT
jgi:hypothetical protein